MFKPNPMQLEQYHSLLLQRISLLEGKITQLEKENSEYLGILKSSGLVRTEPLGSMALVFEDESIPIEAGQISYVTWVIALHEKEDIAFYFGKGFFPGPPEKAQEKLAQLLWMEVQQIPLPSDFRRLDSLPGVTEELFTDVLAKLVPFRVHDQLRERYDEVRLMLFDKYIWPAVQKADPDTLRFTVRDIYNKKVELTFENQAKRMGKNESFLHRVTPKLKG